MIVSANRGILIVLPPLILIITSSLITLSYLQNNLTKISLLSSGPILPLQGIISTQSGSLSSSI